MKWAVLIIATAAAVLPALSGRAADPVSPPVITGAVTRGGEGGRVIVVDNLNDSGPGSLRAAIDADGARIVRFAVGGDIRLAGDLKIRRSRITIAGESAPSPGITLRGASVRIWASDVILRHLRVRVGAEPGPPPFNRDGISIVGDRDGKLRTENVLIDHCSVSWAIDEGISLWFPNISGITIRNTIISESLDKSLHPKGSHSTGLLVGPGSTNVLIQGNLLAHNGWRNPVLTAGVTAVVANNLIYNPGHQAVHFYGNEGRGPSLAMVVGNVARGGPSSKRRQDMFGIQGIAPSSRIYMRDNISDGINAFGKGKRLPFDPFVGRPPVTPAPAIRLMPARLLPEAVVAKVGARPWDRDATDLRILSEVKHRTGRIRDSVPKSER